MADMPAQITSEAGAPAGYFDELQRDGFFPGWAKREPQMWPTPRTPYVPAVWRMADAARALKQAAAFVSPEQAERRNLILANPVPGNDYPTCKTLVAAYQLVMPGETARSHRHSPNALRLVLEAPADAYTLVEGARIDVAPDDLVLTPQWHWHGHANYGEKPVLWIDVLDVPLVQSLENMFFEHHAETVQAVEVEAPNSPFRFAGPDMVARAGEAGTVRVGVSHMPTMALTVEAVRPGDRLDERAGIANTILVPMQGSLVLSTQALGEVRLERGDVAVVPSWHAFSIYGASEDGVLFRVTDAPVFTALGYRDLSTPVAEA